MRFLTLIFTLAVLNLFLLSNGICFDSSKWAQYETRPELKSLFDQVENHKTKYDVLADTLTPSVAAKTFEGTYHQYETTENYKKIISSLKLKDIPAFIKRTYILVKFYDFNLSIFSKFGNEKLLNLCINENANINEVQAAFNELCEQDNSVFDDEWPDLPIPDVHYKALGRYLPLL